MFGGGAARGGFGGADRGFGAARGPRRGHDVEATTSIPFRDAVEGSTVSLRTAEGVTLKSGGRVTFTTGEADIPNLKLPVTYEKLEQDVKAGERILLDDGLLSAKVPACPPTDSSPTRPSWSR